jgi:threonine/homoserine/homoserine lactone efflux protein
MLEILLSAFGLGVAVSIPVGSFTIAASRRAVTHGFGAAFIFTLGSLLADAFYVLLAYLGLAPLLAASEIVRLLLWTFGGAWLCWLGWDALRTRIDAAMLQGDVQPDRALTGFMAGLGVTLLNPVTIVGWIAVAGSFFAGWSDNWLPLYPYGLLAITGMLLGTLIYSLAVLGFLSWIRRFINPRILTGASMLAGIALILFGLGAWWSALRLIWV